MKFKDENTNSGNKFKKTAFVCPETPINKGFQKAKVYNLESVCIALILFLISQKFKSYFLFDRLFSNSSKYRKYIFCRDTFLESSNFQKLPFD